MQAVDSRRHGLVCSMATAMSTPDFIRQVKEKMPPHSAVPSTSWVAYQFWPKNPFEKAAMQYTGRLDIKHMVQARVLNHDHVDSHYAAAVFRNLRELAIKLQPHCTLVCMNDKHGVKVGEPHYPIAAVDRGRSVLVGKNTVFAVSDKV